MKSLLAFASIQIMIYVFSMSSTFTITLLVLGSAVTLFAGAYLSALIKDKQHRRKTVNAALELQ
jgi:hypothetical protein